MLIIDADKIVYKPDVVNEDLPILIDFDKTDKIEFHTKHGKTVEFVKQKHGHWNGYFGSSGDNKKDWLRNDGYPIFLRCDQCHRIVVSNGSSTWNYCPNCGAKMDEEIVNDQ